MSQSFAPLFDLHSTGLSDAQLKSIAGARPTVNTVNATVSGITRCCTTY